MEYLFIVIHFIMSAVGWTYSLVEPCNWPFVFVFTYKYARALVQQFGYMTSRPSRIPTNPRYRPCDVTVIVPTIDPSNEDFAECMRTTLLNEPGEMILVTVGKDCLKTLSDVMQKYRDEFPLTKIRVCATSVANKRKQVSSVLSSIDTRLTLLLDDHVFWPSQNFLPAVIAPFEDPEIGGVATVKKVRRSAPGHFNWAAFWNMLGAIYLERHNFEIQATNSIDGGIFVISGRTALYRTEILQSESFMRKFTNERFFFGMYGPLNADDDNFITREIVKADWKIKVQNHPDAFIETTVGTYPKFLSQCVRWARTTWRSNPASLFTDDGTCWWRFPWTTWAVFVYTFFNFSAVIDTTLMIRLSYTTWYASADSTSRLYMYLGLMLWIALFKMQKLYVYYVANPWDLCMFPFYMLWAWYHSLIKAYSMFTFFDVVWGGRDLSKFSAPQNSQ